MLKAILAVIASYVALSVVVFASFSAAWLILGVDGSFQPESWEVSLPWLLMSFGVGLGAAMFGGYLCALIAGPKSSAPMALAAVVVACPALRKR